MRGNIVEEFFKSILLMGISFLNFSELSKSCLSQYVSAEGDIENKSTVIAELICGSDSRLSRRNVWLGVAIRAVLVIVSLHHTVSHPMFLGCSLLEYTTELLTATANGKNKE